MWFSELLGVCVTPTPRIPIYGVIQDLMTAFEETPRKLPLLEFHQDPQAEQKVKEEKEDDDDKPRGSPLRPTRSATSSSALALKENVNSENLKAADGVEDDHIDAESER